MKLPSYRDIRFRIYAAFLVFAVVIALAIRIFSFSDIEKDFLVNLISELFGAAATFLAIEIYLRTKDQESIKADEIMAMLEDKEQRSELLAILEDEEQAGKVMSILDERQRGRVLSVLLKK